jgi:hypothetical protein
MFAIKLGKPYAQGVDSILYVKPAASMEMYLQTLGVVRAVLVLRFRGVARC